MKDLQLTPGTPSTGVLRVKVRPLSQVDTRTDEEIIQAITHSSPVTSEQNIWAFWDSGFAAMPPWQKRNVLGWARILGPQWTIRVLDLLPDSPANVYHFLDAANLPKHFKDQDKKTTGRFAGANMSDTIRLACIYQHGGVWMDVGIILFMHLDQICWHTIQNPRSKIEMAVASADPTLKSGTAENFFIAARKGNAFIKRWMLVLVAAWEGRTTAKDIHTHPLFHHLVRGGNLTHVFHSSSGAKLDHFQAYLAYDRLRLLEDPTDGFSGPSYCKNRVLLIDYKECALSAMLANDSGPEQFRLFTTRCDRDQDSEDFHTAREYFERVLSSAAMIKLYHWRESEVPTLACLWDQPENANADCRPGTFGEYIRHLSRHFTQDRKVNTVKFPPIREKVLVAGLLETFDE
ncbi:hypothetical protein BDW75DRAFT_249269 [Aspergillus navahoensis]